MVKRAIGLVLAAIMVFSLVGCGSTKEEYSVGSNSAPNVAGNMVVGEKSDDDHNDSPLGDFITENRSENIKDRLSKANVIMYNKLRKLKTA